MLLINTVDKMWKKAVLILVMLGVCQCKPENPSREKSDEKRSPITPHIIFIMADDCGWNDVGFHNKDILTPTLDSLATDGIILNQSYVQNLCTPSRAALMTGYIPLRTGTQQLAIPFFSPTGLPTQFKLLPEKLKKLGYATHMVGKWHLGSCSPAYSPQNRGFDSFFGFYSAGEYHNSHSVPFQDGESPTAGPGVNETYDFFNQSEVALNYNGIYSSLPFRKRVEEIMSNSTPSKPMFLYYASQLVHSPLEVPEDKLSLYPNITNPARKTFSAMMSLLDDDIKHLIELLKQYGLYNDSLIIFSGDNGGEVNAGGCNYPLRGSKHTLWEGGHRVPAFVHSPMLEKKGFTYNGLFHIVDWHTTILNRAGGVPGKDLEEDLDGFDMWPAMTENLPSPRTEFVYHLENKNGVIVGAIRAGLPNCVVPPNQVTGKYADTPGGNGFYYDSLLVPPDRLFDLESDPTESKCLTGIMYLPIVTQLYNRLVSFKNQMVHPVFQGNDMNGYPAKNNFTTQFAPLGLNWCDPIVNVTKIDWNKIEPLDPTYLFT